MHTEKFVSWEMSQTVNTLLKSIFSESQFAKIISSAAEMHSAQSLMRDGNIPFLHIYPDKYRENHGKPISIALVFKFIISLNQYFHSQIIMKMKNSTSEAELFKTLEKEAAESRLTLTFLIKLKNGSSGIGAVLHCLEVILTLNFKHC